MPAAFTIRRRQASYIAMYFHGSRMANELHIMAFYITISMRITLLQRRIKHETNLLDHHRIFGADAQRGHGGKRLSAKLHLLPGQMGLRVLLPMHGGQSARADSGRIMLRSRVHAPAFHIRCSAFFPEHGRLYYNIPYSARAKTFEFAERGSDPERPSRLGDGRRTVRPGADEIPGYAGKRLLRSRIPHLRQRRRHAD